MSNAPDEEGSEGGMDHRIGNVDAPLVIAHEPAPRIVQQKIRSTTQR